MSYSDVLEKLEYNNLKIFKVILEFLENIQKIRLL